MAEANAYFASLDPKPKENKYVLPDRFKPGGFTNEDVYRDTDAQKKHERAVAKWRQEEAKEDRGGWSTRGGISPSTV